MRAIFILMLAAITSSANADTRAIYDARDERRTIRFEIDERGNFRAGNENHYRLIVGGDAYQVAEVEGRTYVARVDDLAETLRGTSSPLLRTAAKTFTFLGQKEQEWVRLGRTTVSGWRGGEYRLQDASHACAVEEDPFEHDDDTVVVVSDDPMLEPLRAAVVRHAAEELRMKRSFVSGRSRDAVSRELEELAELGTVIASSEGDIRLVSVEEVEVDPKRLALPAKPMTREEIAALVRAKRNPFKI